MSGPADATSDARPVFAPGVSAEEFHRRLIERTRPARGRLHRVAEFINRSCPDLRKETLEQAAQALAGKWILPGSEGRAVFIGDPPAWTTPRFENEEYLWALNRMPQWKPLLEAFTLTGEDHYAEKVTMELEDWIARVHPAPSFYRPDGRPDADSLGNSAPAPWRSLEMGIRLFATWPRLIEHLAGTKHLPPGRLERMVRSMAVQAEGLSVVTPVIWPDADHNHYFMEMLGLLAAGVLCRDLAAAPAWTEQALRELQRCVAKQFTADGGHVEGCPMYHNECVVLLARFLTLAQEAGSPLADRYRGLCAAAAVHSVHATRPTGQTVPWGDSRPNTYCEVPAVQAYRITGDLRPLQHIGLLLGPARLRQLCVAEIWEMDDPADIYARMEAPPVPAFEPVRFDHGNDQVMMRTAWHADALSVFFACHSPLHPGSGHQHIDLGGFDFCAFGRPLVVDPGPFTYRECEDRRIFKSSAWHSVMTINGREPFDYLSRWRYTPQREGRITAVHRDAMALSIESFHRNYSPALCRRTLALVGDRVLVIIDRAEEIAADFTRQIYFHFDSENVAWHPADGVVRSDHGDVRLALFSSGGMDCDVLPGRISDGWEVARPSRRVRFSDHGGPGHRTHVAILIPSRKGSEIPMIHGLRILERERRCGFTHAGRTFMVKYE